MVSHSDLSGNNHFAAHTHVARKSRLSDLYTILPNDNIVTPLPPENLANRHGVIVTLPLCFICITFLLSKGETHIKSHSFFLIWAENKLSSIGLHDLFGNTKAQTGTRLFCGKKRMKDTFIMVFCYPAATID